MQNRSADQPDGKTEKQTARRQAALFLYIRKKRPARKQDPSKSACTMKINEKN
jgi:hypothetical protein